MLSTIIIISKLVPSLQAWNSPCAELVLEVFRVLSLFMLTSLQEAERQLSPLEVGTKNVESSSHLSTVSPQKHDFKSKRCPGPL